MPLQLQQTGDENGDPSGRYRPARCGNPNLHWLIADWLGLTEPARGESFPLGQRRGRAAHGEDEVPSLGQILPYLYNSNKPGTKTLIQRVDTAPHGVETPNAEYTPVD